MGNSMKQIILKLLKISPEKSRLLNYAMHASQEKVLLLRDVAGVSGQREKMIRQILALEQKAVSPAMNFLKAVTENMPSVYNSPLSSRLALPALLNFLGLRGIGVEVGVFKGEFSELLLNYSGLSKLYSVDPWIHQDGSVYSEDDSNLNNEEFGSIYDQVVEKLKKYGERSVVLRKFSVDAARQFSDGSLDFVYIDANHSYEACREDMETWWPKLKRGGVFSGHDYRDDRFGVKKAADEFVEKHDQVLFCTPEMAGTWYFIKS